MTVLFIGTGNFPTFISRRIRYLSKNDITIKVMSDYGHPVKECHGAIIIPIFSKIPTPSATIRALLSAVRNATSLPKVIKVWAEIPGNSWLQKLAIVLRYHRLLSEECDLVHFQWVGHLASFSWLKPLLKAPFVASARGSMVTVYPTARPGYADVLKESLRMADAVHCVSADIKNACIRWGADAARCFVNYNGIDTSLFKPGQKTTTGPVKTITVGALMWRKGHPYQLLVIKDLLSQGLTLKHLIVGDGHEREGLRYLACRLGVDHQVDFAGNLVETEVIARLQQAHLYISTSAAEGLSNSVMEAAACGLPVVAFDCEGMREIIVDGETGYIVPFGDIAAMAEKIALLAGDTALRQRLGRQAREHVVARFDINRTVPEMIQFYQSVIDGSRHA